MADVRLTATNPEDSSVVPVACNEKGELKLEEPLVVEGPPGDKGDKGDKGDSGDPFSGNFAGDVTFNGNAKVTGDLKVGSFSGFSDLIDNNIENKNGVQVDSAGALVSARTNDITLICNQKGDWNHIPLAKFEGKGISVIEFFKTGAVTFAGNKAGFTAQGNLWCTTERGDTVMLEATVGGAGMWKAYTPAGQWSEKNLLRPMPEDSSQDEPETPQ